MEEEEKKKQITKRDQLFRDVVRERERERESIEDLQKKQQQTDRKHCIVQQQVRLTAATVDRIKTGQQ